MSLWKRPWWTIIVFPFVLFPAALLAQTNCDEGSAQLNRNDPRGITSQEIVQKFAAKEAVFKQARDNYAYTQDVTVQTIDGSTADGEFKEITDITYDDRGRETGLIVYLEGGSPAIEETRSYDDRWNLMEVLRYRNGVLMRRETFSYEFDARGNWVKRSIERETVRGDNSRRELEVNYRTITYY